MPNLPSNFAVVREGKPNGEDWVFRISAASGREVLAVAVSQPNNSRTGPTWSYVFEDDGLNSVDLGSPGSFASLKDGYRVAGLKPSDISRVFVTHGHSDHDGTVPEFLKASSANLFAHESYEFLKPFNSWVIQDFTASKLQNQLTQIGKRNIDQSSFTSRRDRDRDYYNARKLTKVTSSLVDGKTVGDIKVLSTPGHSPDQICLQVDDLLFTGDHVLPEITPHPTTNMVFRKEYRESLPTEIIDPNRLYGLGAYLNSLGKVASLGADLNVMPAHRLFNRNKVNSVGVKRARDIIEHHRRRLSRLIDSISKGDSNLEDLTRGIFSRSKLLGGNLMAALSEIVAHLEFLEESGDIVVTNNGDLRLSEPHSNKFSFTIDSMINNGSSSS